MAVVVTRSAAEHLRQHGSRLRQLRIILHFLVGISAIGAGQALAIAPDGTKLTFSTEWLKGSPFKDYRVPGLFLMVVNGGLNLGAAYGLFKKASWGPAVSLLAGAVLVAWIAVQWAVIGYRHWTQWMWSILFASMMLLALLGLRDGPELSVRNGGRRGL